MTTDAGSVSDMSTSPASRRAVRVAVAAPNESACAAAVRVAEEGGNAVDAALAAGPARVVDLAAAHPISRPAISKHLRLLTEAGLQSRTAATSFAVMPSTSRRTSAAR